jgi:hypothetical protein
MFRPRGQGAIVCSYLTFTDPRLKRPFRLPLVHIRLTHKGKSFRTDALVDSGATGTFLPIELMNILGFNLIPLTENPPAQAAPAPSPTPPPPPTQVSSVLASAVVSSVVATQGDKQEKHQAVGAGGLFGTYKVSIELIEVLKGRHAFCSFPNWTVLVPDKEGAIPHAVLGRDSIFRKFDVTYREKKEEIVFRRPKK